MHGTGAAKPVGGDRLLLAARAQHKREGLENHSRRLGFASSAALTDEGLLRGALPPGRNQQLYAKPERIRHFQDFGPMLLPLSKNESRIIG